MPGRTCLAIVLAAGEGTRMRSSLPKVLHAIGGRTLLAHVLTAATQAGGIRGLSKSMCFSLMAGQAAQSGLKAALMAEQGFTSADDPIGVKHGFADSYAGAPNLSAFTDKLGAHFEILANTYKPYPCGVVIHPVIDACLDVVRARPLDAKEIDLIDVIVNPTTVSLANIPDPKDSSQAQMSTQHWVAASICDRSAGVRQSRPDKLTEPAIAVLRATVRIVPDEAERRESARVSIHLRSGEKIDSAVGVCRGSAQRPMTDEEIEDKFRTQCADRIAPSDIDAIAQAAWRLAVAPDGARIAAHALGRL
jgi:2-methylcitrate dehydratase PrpD